MNCAVQGGRGKGEGRRVNYFLDWSQYTRDTDKVIKWVIVRIAAFFCANQVKICPHMLKSDHRGPRNSKEKFMWVGGGWWYEVITKSLI